MPIYALGDLVPIIDETAFVHPDAVIIGNVTIGTQSSVWPCAVLRGDGGEIRVGARTSIQDGSVVHTTVLTPTRIGDDCVVGHLVHLEGCTIEDGCLVGSGSVVLHEAIVETGGVVGSNAVVPDGMIVPTGSVALGVPAKLREATADTRAGIAIGAEHYLHQTELFRSQLRLIG
ncbi:MAG TPA: gamma carbonic anhydrase family protein [Acidimicrobiales bacterium]|nr:gamma carbonic anhydrase family protein [Acidimicrobiales bacterium]